MISVNYKGLSVLQFPLLNQFPELFHFSSTRSGGCSTGKYDSLNLGFNSGDIPQNVIANRRTLCGALDINYKTLAFPKQTHSATIQTIEDGFTDLDKEARMDFLGDTDAVITKQKGVCVGIKTADCVPILIFDPKQKVVAAVHAGWRGTVQNIVLLTIQKMTREFGCDPSDIFAGIGPSISPELYEVGEEVWSRFDPEFYERVHKGNIDKRLLNLWKANQYQLIIAGVPEIQIEVAQICTLSNPDRFFSARRDGIQTGRMASAIMLK